MKNPIKTKLHINKVIIASLNDAGLGLLYGGIQKVSGDTSWPSNDCSPTKASFACPKL